MHCHYCSNHIWQIADFWKSRSYEKVLLQKHWINCMLKLRWSVVQSLNFLNKANQNLLYSTLHNVYENVSNRKSRVYSAKTKFLLHKVSLKPSISSYVSSQFIIIYYKRMMRKEGNTLCIQISNFFFYKPMTLSRI